MGIIMRKGIAYGGGSVDWENIQNRPFYTAIEVVDVLNDKALTLGGSYNGITQYVFNHLDSIRIIVGRQYMININGTVYECTAEYAEGFGTFLGNIAPSMGNEYVQGSLPFGIAIDYRGFFTYDGLTVSTMTMTGPVEIIHEIDTKYLANSNIANGSANGSLRSNGAMPEDDTYTMGLYAFAEGVGTSAKGYSSHAEGTASHANGYSSHAEGNVAVAMGDCSHAEGLRTTASGSNSHAEGYETRANGSNSHAEGYKTTANGDYSHSEGHTTEASGSCSHAEGWETVASDSMSHAEGYGAVAKGYTSHAEGIGTIAAGYNQHVQGRYNIEDADSKYAHIVGNGSDTARSNAHTLDWNGNAWFKGDVYVGGTSMDNAVRLGSGSVDWENIQNRPFYSINVDSVRVFNESALVMIGGNGNITQYRARYSDGIRIIRGNTYTIEFNGVYGECIAEYVEGIGTFLGNISPVMGGTYQSGDIPFGMFVDTQLICVYGGISVSTMSVTGTVEVVNKIDSKYLVNSNIMNGSSSGSLRTEGAIPEDDTYTMGAYAFAEGMTTTASGDCSHAEGYYTTASGYSSHAEGMTTTASGDCSHAEGAGTSAEGVLSHAEGSDTTAIGGCSHAEGYGTTAEGDCSHAEGDQSVANGTTSHAEGYMTTANGNFSHTEGVETLTAEACAHAEGYGTVAASQGQHVQGAFNVVDYDNTYAHIIGNGENDSSRSNAHTVTWDGAAWYAGQIDTEAGIYRVKGNQAVYFSGSQEIFGSGNWPTQITGNAITSTKTITVSSDERVKNIFDIDMDKLREFVKQVKLVGYSYKEYPNEKHIGVVAQQLLAIDPEIAEYFVREDADGLYSVDYTALTFAMTMCLM